MTYHPPDESAFDAIAAKAAARRAATDSPSEIERIIRIPVVERDVLDEQRAAAYWTARLRKRPDARPLRPIQGWALQQAALAALEGGPRAIACPIGVGHGKTLISLLLPRVMHARRPLLLIPPSMRPQLDRDKADWGQDYDFPPMKVLAYSQLSMAEASTYLEYHKPDLIIADEAHKLRHMTSARAKRVFRYLKEHPECQFVTLSGTLTAKRLQDFAHLLEASLRDYAPIPTHRGQLDQWASVLNPDGEPRGEDLALFDPLIRTFPQGLEAAADERAEARMAFRNRLVRTPGVVATREASIDANLFIVPRRIAVPHEVDAILRKLTTTWTLPSADAAEGEIIADAMTMARAAGQISAGFFYVWDWPGGERGEEWLDRRRNWHAEVRQVLKYSSRAGLDSPLLVWQHVERGGGNNALRSAFEAWTAVRSDGQRWCDVEKPPTRTVWVSKYVVEDAVAWAKKGGPRLLWYESGAMERALAEAGIPTFGAGSDRPDFRKHPVAALSWHVHREGKNLQEWDTQLLIEPPAAGAAWEQLLGRTHRQGQLSDDVLAVVYQHTERLRSILTKALVEADYIEAMQGVKQRLNLAKFLDKEPKRGAEV